MGRRREKHRQSSSRPVLIGKLVHHSFQKGADEEGEKKRSGNIMVPVSHLYNEMLEWT